MCILSLGTSKSEYITPSSSFQLFKKNNREWLAYELKIKHKELILRNLENGKEDQFANVETYQLSKNANTLLFTSVSEEISNLKRLYWVNLHETKPDTPILIWEGSGATNFVLNDAGNHLAFTIPQAQSKSKSIWYYSTEKQSAEPLMNDNVMEIDSNLIIEDISGFSLDGKRIFFSLREKDYPNPPSDGVMVDVWSYIKAKKD